MERGASGGGHPHHHHQQHAAAVAAAAAAAAAAAGHSYMTADEHTTTGQSSFDNPATKKKPPKLRSINRSISMAIDNYAPPPADDAPSPSGGVDMILVEQPLIHRSASPLALRSSSMAQAAPQSLTLPPPLGHHPSGAVSPALSARQAHHLRTFQHLATQGRYQHYQRAAASSSHHASSTSSPTAPHLSPVPGGGGGGGSAPSHLQQQHHQPDIYLVSSSSLGDNIIAGGGVGVGSGVGGARGGSSSPIQFIDDYMLPPTQHRYAASSSSHATHPLKKTMFRRSDTIDVHPASTFQMKKTHSFHAQQDPPAAAHLLDQLLLGAGASNATAASSSSTSRRTSSVRGNFLMPGSGAGGHPGGKELSRSPSPSRRGCRSHRSFNDPTRRPSNKPDSIVDSQIRHPSLNDDLLETLDGGGGGGALFAQQQQNLSLENELFVESRSRSNSHTKMEDVGVEMTAGQRAAAALARKSSSSFEEAAAAAAAHAPPPTTSSSLKKREQQQQQQHHHHPHSRQHSSHSLELDGRPSTSAAAAAAAAAASSGAHGHPSHTSMQLHSAAAAATAAYHFKRGAQHGRSLYLSPNNFEELQVHRPGLIAAAAAFQGTNASASVKQAKALHSASMRLRTYRETLSATKKSKSFIGDSAYPPPIGGGANDFELTSTSPHRRNSRPLSSANAGSGEDIRRSPRPLALTPTAAAAAAAAAFIEEKRPSFERKPSLTYELSDAAFEQVLRPFHHKVAGRKASMSGSHKALKKKSLSDETDEDEEADRKRKRIACIVMTVFLCLVCASVFVVILTLTHSSGQTHPHQHQTMSKKIYTFSRETPVHYNVRQENERLMKETMDRARYGKNYTETAALISTPAQLLASPQIP